MADIKKIMEFVEAANQACKEKGKTYEFTCPVCGGKAIASRSSFNGHLHAKCENCDMHVVE